VFFFELTLDGESQNKTETLTMNMNKVGDIRAKMDEMLNKARGNTTFNEDLRSKGLDSIDQFQPTMGPCSWTCSWTCWITSFEAE
jgi:hypothetical protein